MPITRTIPSGNRIGLALEAQGMVPPNCRNVVLIVEPDSIITLRYEVIVQHDDLPKIAAALQAVAEEEATR